MYRTVLCTVILALFVVMAQAQAQIPPTGNCPDDVYIVQAAISYSWGGTVQLAPGIFNFSCADPATFGYAAVYFGYPGQYQWFAYHLAGTPGQTIIVGPGTDIPIAGLEINYSHTTIEGITLQKFFRAIRVGDPGWGTGFPDVTVQNCTFTDNLRGVTALPVSPDLHLLNNTFNLSQGQNAALIREGSDRFLAVGNVVNGPGPSAMVKTVSDLLALPLSTSGIWQEEINGGTSSFGRISNNTITGVDLGIQSSSNFAVVSGNIVSNSIIAISVSNDNYDGVSMVTDGLVAHNGVTKNQVGIWLNAGARNIIESNDAAGDSIAGVLFLSLEGAPANSANIYFHNTGSVKGMPGNQGRPLIHPLPKD
jgi:hypothetical protein